MNIADLQGAAQIDVSRETFQTLSDLVALVTDEASKQNLISSATVDDIWNRHILDSVQLLKFGNGGPWLDLGTGAGFPGLVIAAFGVSDVVLIEERRLRHEFLTRAVTALGLTNVRVVGDKVERAEPFKARTITARAFAPLEKIFLLSEHFSTRKTRWILPKGRKAHDELESVHSMWHGVFRLEPSVTDPTSSIIIAENVSPRGRK